MPRIGRQYGLKSLQPLPRMLYVRLAELAGITVEQMLPIRLDHKRALSPGNAAEYVPHMHGIAQPRLLSFGHWRAKDASLNIFLREGPNTSLGQHEQIHSILGIMGAVHAWGLGENFSSVGGRNISKTDVRLDAVKLLNSVYHRFGPDGLLAVFARSHNLPDKFSLEMKHEHVEVLRKLPDELERKGLLTKKGFTQKGVDWFKTMVPPHEIRQRIERIRSQREYAARDARRK